jgi:hypothetical protein
LCMPLRKLTTILVVDVIEPCLPTWRSLGFEITTEVPHGESLGFVILTSAKIELMLQTRASLAEDLPEVAKKKPSTLLYADVKSLAQASKRLAHARVLVPERKTFYGATEIWIETESGQILGLAEL